MSKRGRKAGFSPVTGWDGVLTKNCKRWSMPQSDWDWLELQPNQSETLRRAIAYYRQHLEPPLKTEKINRRQILVDFLRNNPGWHDAYKISEAIKISPRQVQHLASLVERKSPIEIKKGTDNRNHYKYKEKQDFS
jgi:hypothetical protein